MQATELTYLTLTEAADLIAAKQVSPVELTQAMLDRISALDGALHAYITVTADIALARAREAEAAVLRDGPRSPVDGIPVAYKDLYATAGVLTTAASHMLADWTPNTDATAVAKLHAGGAVMLGKLMMSEFASGSPEHGAYGQHALNPWNVEHIPGGSSSGSGTALAAGLCYGSLGSDTGGSIRGPASMSGIVGLKPTYGRVSRAGVVPLSWSLDHAGPMARTAEDCAVLLQQIAGYDPADIGSANVPVPDFRAALRTELRGLRVGVARRYFYENLHEDTAARVEAALGVMRDLGAEVIELEIPEAELTGLQNIISGVESYTYHKRHERERGHLFGTRLRSRMQQGAAYFAHEYLDAQRGREIARRAFNEALTRVDVLVAPTNRAPAERIADFLDAIEPPARPTNNAIFNLVGLPSMSLCCGFTSAGLPVGLQISGRAFEEGTVLAVGHAYQQATDWHRQHPPLG